MPNGYWGKTAFINLSTGSIKIEQPPEEVYRRYLGGYGLGVSVLYEQMPAGADPLGPQNIIGFLPGLLTGSGAPFGGRFMVVAKSQGKLIMQGLLERRSPKLTRIYTKAD